MRQVVALEPSRHDVREQTLRRGKQNATSLIGGDRLQAVARQPHPLGDLFA